MMTTLTALLMLAGPALAGDLHTPDVTDVGIPELSDAALDEMLTDPDWTVRHRAALAKTWRMKPDLARELTDMQPGVTRAGGARFVLPKDREGAAPVLVERFLRGGDSPATRSALVDAMPRTKGEWAPAMAASFASEEAPAVRAMIVEALRREDPALVAPVLISALEDTELGVRAAAARSMGWSGDADRYTSLLVGALGDSSSAVRADTSRALGWLHAAGAWDALVAGLGDDDALVRLNTLRALERIDASRAAAQAEIGALKADSDAKVARAAGQIHGK
jgi:HEAT repeat protein